jgi:hypothetical protein
MAISLSGKVRAFLSIHPHIRECLKQGLVNYSALARLICSQNGNRNFEGTVAACRRAAERLPERKFSNNLAQQILAHSHISVVNDISVAVLEKPIDQRKLAELEIAIRELRGEFNRIEGRDLITIVFSSRFGSKIKNAFDSKLHKLVSDLAQVTILFDERFESTFGVVSAIYNRFAADGVNIREELSCSANLMLIVAESDADKAVKLLTGLQTKNT